VCTSWIWNENNIPKLGGFGKVVEMDESFFAGAPKFNRGRRLGTSWEDDEKWVFGVVQRDSLNCVLQQVPSKIYKNTVAHNQPALPRRNYIQFRWMEGLWKIS